MLHKESVSPKLLAVLETLMKMEVFKPFRLVGGSALALRSGHRNSVDIDLFSYNEFPRDSFEKLFNKELKNTHSQWIGERSLLFFLNDIKVDIYAKEIPFIRSEYTEENIRLASFEDIAAMKLEVITARATKKDYYDIAELLKLYTFRELLGFYQENFPAKSTRNVLDVFKEIPRRNFELEKSTPPHSYRNLSWADVKQIVFEAFDNFRNEELNAKIEEMNKRKKEQ